MDADRFDLLVQSLHRAGSRRRALGLVAVGALGALGPSAAAAQHKKKCKNGRKLCNGVCVNLQNDEQNCGKCGHLCAANETCKTGSCVCTPDCQGKTCGDDGCGGSCGTCSGPTCQGTTVTNQTCDAGVCTPHPTSCGTGQVCFQNACCSKGAKPACNTTNVSDHCGGFYPPNCSHHCCEDLVHGGFVCQTLACQ